ncbi:MAG TPA: methyltransferase domain-containing protein [Candidatus Norongarragalinales archaeon]|nr:methyltransferase domain-containing protein [Candidatus Norongarragalinales archaeon]
MGWKVRRERPEEKFKGNAGEFYSMEGAAYEKNAIRHIQEKILLRGLQLVQFQPHSKLLDVGCGTGLGMKILKALGFKVEGIDVSKELLAIAKKRKLAVKLGDMRSIPFLDSNFDGIVSISALQWVTSRMDFEGKADLKKTAGEFYRILKPSGKALIQFYPRSEEEMMLAGKAFKDAGFKVRIEIENERNARKRRIYLLLSKT